MSNIPTRKIDLTVICPRCGKTIQHAYEEEQPDWELHIAQMLARLQNVVSSVMTEMLSHRWSKNQGQKDSEFVRKLMMSLNYLLNMIAKYGQGIDKNVVEAEVSVPEGTVSRRAKDFAWEFRRTFDDRLFEGVAFSDSMENAKEDARLLSFNYGIRAEAVVIFPSEEYAERYLVMIPRDPLSDTEAYALVEAKKFLLDLRNS